MPSSCSPPSSAMRAASRRSAFLIEDVTQVIEDNFWDQAAWRKHRRNTTPIGSLIGTYRGQNSNMDHRSLDGGLRGDGRRGDPSTRRSIAPSSSTATPVTEGCGGRTFTGMDAQRAYKGSDVPAQRHAPGHALDVQPLPACPASGTWRPEQTCMIEAADNSSNTRRRSVDRKLGGFTTMLDWSD